MNRRARTGWPASTTWPGLPRAPVETRPTQRRLGLADMAVAGEVKLRLFGGLGVQETAEVLKVSPETVMRDWKTAKAWLLRELSPAGRARSR